MTLEYYMWIWQLLACHFSAGDNLFELAEATVTLAEVLELKGTPLAWWRGRSSRAAQTKAKGECKQDIPTVSEIHKNYTLCYIIYPISCCVSTGAVTKPSSTRGTLRKGCTLVAGRAGLKCASCLMSITRPWVRPDPASLWRSWDGRSSLCWRGDPGGGIRGIVENFPYRAIFGNTLFWLSLLSILLTRSSCNYMSLNSH